jgi:hypothetical protein
MGNNPRIRDGALPDAMFIAAIDWFRNLRETRQTVVSLFQFQKRHTMIVHLRHLP